jgi:hypothetical protein
LAEAVGERANASEPGRRAADEWTPDQRQLLHDLTAEEAAQYGYSVD